MTKPLIGISALYNADGDIHATRSTYIRAIQAAGGEVVLLPCAPDTAICHRLIESVDGFLVPGGPDISPLLFGEQPLPQAPTTRKSEDLFEIALIKEAIAQNKPILGICRGLQILNVALGGSLYQDIPSQGVSTICHKQGNSIREEGTHTVTLTAQSKLAQIFGCTKIDTNSYHHQAAKHIAQDLHVVGVSCDNVVEAMENEDGSILAVQWHPECMPQEQAFRNLFEDFIRRCRK